MARARESDPATDGLPFSYWMLLAHYDADHDKRIYVDQLGHRGPALYHLGTKSGGQMITLYVGETDQLFTRWSAYARDGSHLGAKQPDENKRVLSEAFYHRDNALYGRYVAMKSKKAAEDAERAMLAKHSFMWNVKLNSSTKAAERADDVMRAATAAGKLRAGQRSDSNSDDESNGETSDESDSDGAVAAYDSDIEQLADEVRRVTTSDKRIITDVSKAQLRLSVPDLTDKQLDSAWEKIQALKKEVGKGGHATRWSQFDFSDAILNKIQASKALVLGAR